ncbi:hypothetical protein B0H17DRAFT_1046892 [Mycena rosella]|uniref:Uncharacterized protein n=1 Tax=Mycena rosella TaxID=1033263 RepID=A0AAD7GPC8_MYCRO|nr:hypothetical protein B0H17DRAFT_1046892 [Mycena rosella]
MDEGLQMDEMNGSAPQELCANESNNDRGAYDRLPADKQKKWNRKASARNKKSLAFSVNYFKPISVHLEESPDVLSITVLLKIFPKQIVPEPDLEDQVYGNALMSQMAQLPHYDADLSRSLLQIFIKPTWYNGIQTAELRPEAFRTRCSFADVHEDLDADPRGHPEVGDPWPSDKLLASVACVGEAVSLYHNEALGRQLWDVYSVLLASPRTAPEIKALILSQTRYNFMGFRIILHKIFTVSKAVLSPRRSVAELGLDEIDVGIMWLILAEERRMQWTEEEEVWLKEVLPPLKFAWKPRLAHAKSLVSSTKDAVSSRDIFCAWCL